MEREGARALLSGVVDYAGLFPPAGLPMQEAVREYVAASRGAEAWLLGRFVLPAARLFEFADVTRHLPQAPDEVRLSAIVRDGSTEDLRTITTFNEDAMRCRARVDALEYKPESPQSLDWLAGSVASAFEMYVEVPVGADAPPLLDAIAARGMRAKVRTGGMSAEAFPAPDLLLAFITAAVDCGVPFKATAGLHHAVRGTYPLTYEAGASGAPMYGYLNVLLATAAICAGVARDVVLELLCERDAASFTFREDRIGWRGVDVPTSTLRATRERHLVSFGSCSFREPADEYRALASCGAQTADV